MTRKQSVKRRQAQLRRLEMAQTAHSELQRDLRNYCDLVRKVGDRMAEGAASACHDAWGHAYPLGRDVVKR